MPARSIAPFITLTLVGALGCQVHPVTRPESVAPPVALPAAWSGGGEAAVEARWWTAFGDPGLDALMARVEAQNLDLKQAWARLDRARAEADAASAGWWPTLDASVQASRQRSALFGQAREFSLYQANLAARYELDLWGRVSALTDAAEWQAAAGALDVQAVAMSLSASVGDAWFELAGQRALAELLVAHVERNRTLLERLEQRFEQGLATAVAVGQQRGALLATEGLLPPVRARVAALRNRLGVLSGVAPGVEIPLPAAAVADAPPLPATGVPGDVMRRRPDLRAARFRVAAADARVAAALADRFPTFALTGSVGVGGPTPSALVEQWLWSIAASIAGPLIDGGRRAAVVEQQRAMVREGLAALGQAWLVALAEVEGALVAIGESAARLEILEAERRSAAQLVEEAEARYLAGLGDYLPVVTAIRGAQAAERALLAARVERLRLHVTLRRALGGGFEPARPRDDRETAEETAEEGR